MGEGKTRRTGRRMIQAAMVMLPGALLTGCVGQAPAGPHAVGLSLVAPTDGASVNVRSITVLGHVNPANAHVKVAGRPAAVRRGVFHFRLALPARLNHIGISATAPGYNPATIETIVHYRRRHGPPLGHDYADRAERMCTTADDQLGTLPKFSDQNVGPLGRRVLAIEGHLVQGLVSLAVPRSIATAYHRLTAKLQAGLPVAERGLEARVHGDLAGLLQAAEQFKSIESEPALYNEASRLDIPDCGGVLDTGLHGK